MTRPPTRLSIRRIYEARTDADGLRILVDRLWPRGLRKEAAHLDHWCKDVAPSPGLRTWFDHRADRFAEFRKKYEIELAASDAAKELLALVTGRTATLLYGARDPDVNHAIVLRAFLERRLSR
jgi:uncharacterized protein YeaO (DUF488 family)